MPGIVVFIFMALIYSAIAWVAKRYPGSINGYSSMSRKRKKYVDLDRAAFFLHKLFLIAGWGAVGVYLIFWYLTDYQGWKAFMPVWWLFGTLIFGVIYVNYKYDRLIKGKIDRFFSKLGWIKSPTRS